MTTQSIIKALNVPNNGTYAEHARKLAAILKFLSQIKNEIDKATVNPSGVMYFGREHCYNLNRIDEQTGKPYIMRTICEGDKFDAATFTITTKTGGEYNIQVPAKTDVYNYVCFLLGIDYDKPLAPEKQAGITCGPEIIPIIKKAVKFISKDTLRPPFMHVCIHAKGDSLVIVGTNAYWIYTSEPIPYKGDFIGHLMLDKDACKAITAIKDKKANLQFFIDGKRKDNSRILEGKGDVLVIAGDTHIRTKALTDVGFADYEAVIPPFEAVKPMQVQKQVLTDAIKPILPFTNRVTNQLNFHLNGSVSVKASNIDYDLESGVEVPYISKQFSDLDIAFNGNYLLDVMETLCTYKPKTSYAHNPDVITWHVRTDKKEPQNSAVLFTGNTTSLEGEKILLMPLMIGL